MDHFKLLSLKWGERVSEQPPRRLGRCCHQTNIHKLGINLFEDLDPEEGYWGLREKVKTMEISGPALLIVGRQRVSSGLQSSLLKTLLKMPKGAASTSGVRGGVESEVPERTRRRTSERQAAENMCDAETGGGSRFYKRESERKNSE